MVLWQTWWAGIYRVEYCLVGNYIRWNFLDCNNPGGKFPGGSCPRWEFSRWELSWVGNFRVGIIRVGVILGGNFLWWGFSGWELSEGNHPGRNFPGGSFPSTLKFSSIFNFFFWLVTVSRRVFVLFCSVIVNAR